jgi:hypothetical protein
MHQLVNINIYIKMQGATIKIIRDIVLFLIWWQ